MSASVSFTTRHLFVRGRVQGVYYRASTVQQARQLGLTGWVRNRSDGRVEAVVHGPVEAVTQLIAWAHQGPADARVDAVDITTVDASEWGGPFASFEQRSTV